MLQLQSSNESGETIQKPGGGNQSATIAGSSAAVGVLGCAGILFGLWKKGKLTMPGRSNATGPDSGRAFRLRLENLPGPHLLNTLRSTFSGRSHAHATEPQEIPTEAAQPEVDRL